MCIVCLTQIIIKCLADTLAQVLALCFDVHVNTTVKLCTLDRPTVSFVLFYFYFYLIFFFLFVIVVQRFYLFSCLVFIPFFNFISPVGLGQHLNVNNVLMEMKMLEMYRMRVFCFED